MMRHYKFLSTPSSIPSLDSINSSWRSSAATEKFAVTTRGFNIGDRPSKQESPPKQELFKRRPPHPRVMPDPSIKTQEELVEERINTAVQHFERQQQEKEQRELELFETSLQSAGWFPVLN